MRFIAILLGGLLLAAAAYVAMLSPAERARVLRVAPTPTAVARPTAAPARAPAEGAPGADPGRVPADAAPGADPGRGPSGSGLPIDTGRAPPAGAGPPAPLPSGLIIPVPGVAPASLAHTFEDARSGGRVHEALDIMAPAGTPVVAVADGHVEKLFDSRQGGLTVYQFEPGGRYAYYYAHLERYAPGLVEQQPLRQGDVIGYVGSSGNADPAAPHLHFAIFRLGPEQRWWEGEPVDPWPLLSGRRP